MCHKFHSFQNKIYLIDLTDYFNSEAGTSNLYPIGGHKKSVGYYNADIVFRFAICD